MGIRPFKILLVDDDFSDVELTRQILRKSRVPVQIQSVSNGETALAFLRRENGHALAPRPDLILLDLDMPVMDGRELLRTVKADPSLKFIPVVVLTTFNVAEEIVSSYGLGANAYVNKPMDISQFAQVEQIVEDFWIRRQQLRHEDC